VPRTRASTPPSALEDMAKKAPAKKATAKKGPAGDLLDFARRIAGMARGGEEVEVFVARGVDTDVRAYDGEVEHLQTASSAGVGIRVVSGGRQGFSYAGYLDEEVAKAVLEEARDNAGFSSPDEHVSLALPDGVAAVAMDVFDPELASWPTERKVQMALEMERAARKADPRVRQVSSADYSDSSGEAAIATSTGIEASFERTGCHVSASVIAGEGDDSHTGVGFSVARGPSKLDPDRAVADAVERATRLIGGRKTRSGPVTVVFDPRVASTFLGVVASSLSGEAVTKGRSLFAGRVGEQVASGLVSIVDDPTDERAYSAASHDAEGLASRRNVLIEGGVLRGFVFDTISASRAGTRSSASAVRGGYASTPVASCRAVQLAPGEMDAAEVIAFVEEGIYVQSVTGVHSGVNPISGDFSVGAEGLAIRGGELAEAVREVTVASTIQRMLLGIVAVGADLEWLPSVAAGQTIAIEGMTLSGH
jgi:PmbA protein